VKPALLVIAGPNGAGKTTVTSRLRAERWSQGVEYLNPDDIARDRFGDWNSPEAVLQAVRWAEARREELLAAGRGIAFETVLSTPSKIDFLARAREQGYFVRVFFIGTNDPRINAARIAGRIMEGGHSVPIEKIVTRYVRSMANVSAAVRLADRAYVYDNSIDDVEARLCFRSQDGKLRKIYGDLPGWVVDATQGLERHAQFVDMRAA
jgi:predicted ABC-type ATPase